MAEIGDNSDFWFLTDEDILRAKAKPNHLRFSADRPYGIDAIGGGSASPALYSSTDSVVSSPPETESDEEDLIAELTRCLARSAIPDNHRLDAPENSRVLSGSPQSTLRAFRSWSGSPNVASRDPSSQPPRVVTGISDGWDAVCEAAGEYAALNMGSEALKYLKHDNIYHPNRRLIVDHSADLFTLPVPPPRKTPSPVFDFYSNQILMNHQFRNLSEDYAMKQKRYSELEKYANEWVLLQGQIKSRERRLGLERGRHAPSLGLPRSARPPQQPQHQHRHYSGTGVFLPRPYGSPSEPRKKQGHSSAGGVVSAPVPQQAGFNRSFTLGDYESLMSRRHALLVEQQKRVVRQEMAGSNEMRLPQEWTY